MKKIVNTLIIFLLFTVNLTIITFADTDIPLIYTDRECTEKLETSEMIYSGEIIYLKLTGISSNDIIELESTSFEMLETTNPVLAENIKINRGFSLPLYYNGGKDRAIKLIEYSQDGKNKKEKNYYISKAVPDYETDGNESVNNNKKNKKKNPEFKVENKDIPEFYLGEKQTISLDIKNISKYNGDKVKIDVKMPQGFEGEEVSSSKDYKIIRAGKQVRYEAKFNVYSGMKPGIYPVEVIYSYLVNEERVQVKETINVRVLKKSEPAKITVSDVIIDDEFIEAGEEFNIEFNINNKGSYLAHSIKVYIEDNINGFIGKDGENEKETLILMPKTGQEKFKFPLKASNQMTVGNHELKINIKYQDQQDNEHLISKPIIIDIKGVKEESGKVYFGDITSSTFNIGEEEEEFTITVPVINNTYKEVDNIYVSLIVDEKVRLLSNPRMKINSINTGETEEVSFNIKKNKDVFGTSNINIKLHENGEDISSVVYPIYIEKEKKIDSSKPIIIVEKYAIDPNVVMVGKEFDVSMQFKNTHKNKSVENIRVMLESTDNSRVEGGSIFTSAGGSSTFYIDSIGPKGVKSILTKLFTPIDTKANNYKVSVNIEYEYREGDEIKSYQVKDKIDIIVRQQSSFDTTNINIPDTGKLGEEIEVEFEVFNTGKVDLSNFKIEYEGEFKGKKEIIGKIQPGENYIYYNYIEPMAKGEQVGAIILSYEDATGEVIVERIEFTVDVHDDEEEREALSKEVQKKEVSDKEKEAEEKTLLAENSKGKNNSTLFMLVVAALAVVAVASVIVIRKKKRDK